MSNLAEVNVTRGDLRDVVIVKSKHVPGVLVDAVVNEVNERLHLVGVHNATTALRADTVPQWINQEIDDEYGADGFEKVLKNNVDE
jgi:hypothetical protein